MAKARERRLFLMDLGPTSMNAELARQIIKAKALAQRNRTARNRTLFTGIMIGVSVSTALYVLGLERSDFMKMVRSVVLRWQAYTYI